MPNIMTAATIAILFNSLFAYPKGPVNDLLMMLGISENQLSFCVKGGQREILYHLSSFGCGTVIL